MLKSQHRIVIQPSYTLSPCFSFEQHCCSKTMFTQNYTPKSLMSNQHLSQKLTSKPSLSQTLIFVLHSSQSIQEFISPQGFIVLCRHINFHYMCYKQASHSYFLEFWWCCFLLFSKNKFLNNFRHKFLSHTTVQKCEHMEAIMESVLQLTVRVC